MQHSLFNLLHLLLLSSLCTESGQSVLDSFGQGINSCPVSSVTASADFSMSFSNAGLMLDLCLKGQEKHISSFVFFLVRMT